MLNKQALAKRGPYKKKVAEQDFANASTHGPTLIKQVESRKGASFKSVSPRQNNYPV